MQPVQSDHSARVAIQPGFVWDAQDAYLFDIDGTLLRDPDRVHYNAFAAGVFAATGLELSLAGVAIAGSTDTAILREGWAATGLDPALLETHYAAILAAMCSNVAAARSTMRLVRMPGVEEALRHLAARGALLGVATGNLEAIGWLKIESVGLRPWFRFGGFSDSFPVRSELIADAARKARAIAGPAASVCVVGDTPRDIAAARAGNLPVIAVATGHFSFDELAALHPEACATSLADLLAHAQAAQ